MYLVEPSDSTEHELHPHPTDESASTNITDLQPVSAFRSTDHRHLYHLPSLFDWLHAQSADTAQHYEHHADGEDTAECASYHSHISSPFCCRLSARCFPCDVRTAVRLWLLGQCAHQSDSFGTVLVAGAKSEVVVGEKTRVPVETVETSGGVVVASGDDAPAHITADGSPAEIGSRNHDMYHLLSVWSVLPAAVLGQPVADGVETDEQPSRHPGRKPAVVLISVDMYHLLSVTHAMSAILSPVATRMAAPYSDASASLVICFCKLTRLGRWKLLEGRPRLRLNAEPAAVEFELHLRDEACDRMECVHCTEDAHRQCHAIRPILHVAVVAVVEAIHAKKHESDEVAVEDVSSGVVTKYLYHLLSVGVTPRLCVCLLPMRCGITAHVC